MKTHMPEVKHPCAWTIRSIHKFTASNFLSLDTYPEIHTGPGNVYEQILADRFEFMQENMRVNNWLLSTVMNLLNLI